MKTALPVIVLAVSTAITGLAQTPAELKNQPAVKAAFAAIQRDEAKTIDNQIHLTEIPAPPFKEEVRAKEVMRIFNEIGLKQVRMDKAWNVIGVRPGKAVHPNVVLAAHLDTVFPEGTNVKVRREGTVLHAPGICDDGCGLATIIAVAKAMNEAKIETPGTITFVADVGEEGLGDLRGMKMLFNETLKGQVDKFVSIDDAGSHITNGGVGSYRYRITYKGPGGHSYGAFGIANPIHALGRAIETISNFQVPAKPKTTFSVGRIGGGTSVNAIAFEAWMEVDMRSEDMVPLNEEDKKFNAAVQGALAAENKRWNNKSPLTVTVDRVGFRPAGITPESNPIVQTALSVNKAMGIEKTEPRASSTDSNFPMSLKIPAITTGGGGKSDGAHSADEKYDTKDQYLGTQRVLLLILSLAR